MLFSEKKDLEIMKNGGFEKSERLVSGIRMIMFGRGARTLIQKQVSLTASDLILM